MKKHASKNQSNPVKSTAGHVRISQAVANEQFVKKQPRKDNGSNSVVEDFVRCADFVVRANRSFDFNHVAYSCFQLGIPSEEVKRLWAEYSDFLISKGRLERIQGCDGELFLTLN
jgi:hypothetical protein